MFCTRSILGVHAFYIQKLHDQFIGNGSVSINIHRHTDHIHPMPLWEQNPTNSLGCSFRHEKWPWSSTTQDECRLFLRFYQQKSYSWWCFNTATSEWLLPKMWSTQKNAYKHLDTSSVTQECVISVCVCVSVSVCLECVNTENNLVVYILTYIPCNQHIALASAKVPKFSIMFMKIDYHKMLPQTLAVGSYAKIPAASGEAMWCLNV